MTPARPPTPAERVVWLLVTLAIGCAYLIPAPYSEMLNNPNENVRVYMTRAIVEYRTFAIDEIVRQWGYVNDKATAHGNLYPGKAPGTSFLAVPGWAVGRWLHALLDIPVTKRAIVEWCRLTATTIPVLLFLAMFARQTRRVTDSHALRALATLMLGVGSSLLCYGGLAASHATAAAAIFGGWLASLEHRDAPSRWSAPLLAGFLFGWSISLEYPAALGAGVAWVLAVTKSPQRARWIVGTVVGSLPPLALMGIYHWVAFGAPWSLPYSHLENPQFAAYVSGGFFGLKVLKSNAFMGSFFAPATGLFWFVPWTVAAIAALPLAIQNPRLRETALLTLATFVVYAIFISMVRDWRGGWGAGPRYIVPVLPVLAWSLLATLDAIPRGAWRRAAALGIAGLTLAAMVNCGISAAFFPHYPLESANPIAEIGFLLPTIGLWPYTRLGYLGVDAPTALGVAALVCFAAWLAIVTALGSGRSVLQNAASSLSVLAAAALVVGTQSLVETPDARDLDIARSVVAEVWQPRPTAAQQTIRGGRMPDCVLARTCTQTDWADTARAAAALKADRTALLLWLEAFEAEGSGAADPR